MFANGPGDWGSVSGWVIPKIKKMVLDASLLNTQHYKVQIKDKWSNPGKGVAACPIPWCCRYWRGSFQVVLNCGWPTYIYIRFIYLMLWKFVCNSWISWSFYKTIIRQITKWNELKIEKYSQKPLGLCRNLYVCFCVYVSQTNFHGIKYINLIHIYLLL